MTKYLNRFIELDLIRGMAVILMIVAHVYWDLDYYNISSMDNSLYPVLQRSVAILFFSLVGVGLSISKRRQGDSFKRRSVSRGLGIIGLGLLLTIVSLFIIPERPIYFGVLHCIGLSTIVCALLLRDNNWLNLAFGITLISLGAFLSMIPFNDVSAVPMIIGLRPTNIWDYTLDYFPLLPWLGVCIIGFLLGNKLYDKDRRKFNFIDLDNYNSIKPISYIGRHSLEIYLVHQPLIVGCLYILKII